MTVGPVPSVAGQFIPRSQIAFRSASDKYFAIVVETRVGQRVHLYSRDADQQTALAAAGAEPTIELRLVPARHAGPASMREFVFWGVLALAALVLGIAWDWRQ